MMNHRELFPDWSSEVAGIFDWVYDTLGNDEWKDYGVRVVNEQTAYQTPGNSHTSRQASAELQYAALTGDLSRMENAVRQLNWATYMVDKDGKNCYPRDENWLTDGYGDYVRHYLRSMAYYRTFDKASSEVLRLSVKPSEVRTGNQVIPESDQEAECWQWTPLSAGGVLTVKHAGDNRVLILK
ncbi:MAG: hypothetical protein V2B15_06800 [Bacteroidota bacterium]